jgi:hypothetical protein
MAAKTYTIMNGAVPGAAAAVSITTGTAIKTMMQLLTTAGWTYRVVEWWTEFNGSAAATPITVELIANTTAPQTTLTTYASADIAPANDPNASSQSTGSMFSLASNASGFGTGATEVTPTGTVRNLSTHFVPPTSGIYIQYPLGREPEIVQAGFLRHRTTAGAAVNCYVGITVEV